MVYDTLDIANLPLWRSRQVGRLARVMSDDYELVVYQYMVTITHLPTGNYVDLKHLDSRVLDKDVYNWLGVTTLK